MGISLPRHHFPALQAQRIQYDIQSFFSVAQMIFQSIFQSYTTAPSPQLCCFTRASKAPRSIGTPLAKRREDLSDFSAKNKAPSLGKKRKKMASLAQAACGLRLVLQRARPFVCDAFVFPAAKSAIVAAWKCHGGTSVQFKYLWLVQWPLCLCFKATHFQSHRYVLEIMQKDRKRLEPLRITSRLLPQNAIAIDIQDVEGSLSTQHPQG